MWANISSFYQESYGSSCVSAWLWKLDSYTELVKKNWMTRNEILRVGCNCLEWSCDNMLVDLNIFSLPKILQNTNVDGHTTWMGNVWIPKFKSQCDEEISEDQDNDGWISSYLLHKTGTKTMDLIHKYDDDDDSLAATSITSWQHIPKLNYLLCQLTCRVRWMLVTSLHIPMVCMHRFSHSYMGQASSEQLRGFSRQQYCSLVCHCLERRRDWINTGVRIEPMLQSNILTSTPRLLWVLLNYTICQL